MVINPLAIESSMTGLLTRGSDPHEEGRDRARLRLTTFYGDSLRRARHGSDANPESVATSVGVCVRDPEATSASPPRSVPEPAGTLKNLFRAVPEVHTRADDGPVTIPSNNDERRGRTSHRFRYVTECHDHGPVVLLGIGTPVGARLETRRQHHRDADEHMSVNARHLRPPYGWFAALPTMVLTMLMLCVVTPFV